MLVSAVYRYAGYVVIRRKEQEIRGNQELSEAHRKRKKKKQGKTLSRPLEYERSQHVVERHKQGKSLTKATAWAAPMIVSQ